MKFMPSRLPKGLLVGCLLLAALWTVFSASADEKVVVPRLTHDPFKKPEQLMPSTQNPVLIKAEENLFQSHSKLTATLRAGKDSMVIVDGKSIKLGESVDGYQLTEVKEHSAVFTKNRQQHFLQIDKSDEVNK